MAENLAEIAPPDPDGAIIHAMDHPIHRTGGLTILRGSLSPDGAVLADLIHRVAKARNHLAGVVLRAVVDDHDLEIDFALCQSRP